MTMIRNGLIGACGVGRGGSSSQLALSDGLACYSQSFSGITTTSFSHNLGTTDIAVEFQDVNGNFLVPDNWQAVNSNTVSVEFASATQGKILVIGCIESGLAPITGGVTTIEGLSGIVDLDCPDGSVNISTSGQVINICTLFTPASGAVLEQKCRDIEILSGLIGTGGGGGVASINNISGVVTLTSPDNSINIIVNGQSIELTTVPNAGQTSINGLSGIVNLATTPGIEIIPSGQTIILSGLFTPASGAILEEKCRSIDTISGVANTATQKIEKEFTKSSGLEFVLEHGLQTDVWVSQMWRTDSEPEELLIPQNVYPSGSNHAVVTFRATDANSIGYDGRIVFVG